MALSFQVVLAAVAVNRDALNHADEDLLEDSAFMLQACQANRWVFFNSQDEYSFTSAISDRLLSPPYHGSLSGPFKIIDKIGAFLLFGLLLCAGTWSTW